MNLNDALAIVKPELKAERYEHTKRVVETAVKLVRVHGGNECEAEVAAALHDIAKYHSKSEMKRIIQSNITFPKDLLFYHHELWHAPIGAMLVKQKYEINNEAILDAICYHTTGRANMSRLEKIIFLADYIEPGRVFPGVEETRELAWYDLEKGCWMALRNTINFLMSKEQPIYPDTFKAYNDLTKQI